MERRGSERSEGVREREREDGEGKDGERRSSAACAVLSRNKKEPPGVW